MFLITGLSSATSDLSAKPHDDYDWYKGIVYSVREKYEGNRNTVVAESLIGIIEYHHGEGKKLYSGPITISVTCLPPRVFLWARMWLFSPEMFFPTYIEGTCTIPVE